MNNDDLMILLIGFYVILVLIYYFYLSWFKPSRYLDLSRKSVGNWWPFADHLRSYYGSSLNLWINRIVSAILMLGLLYGVYRVILS